MSRPSRWPVRVKRGNSTVTIYKADRKKNGRMYREFKLAYYSEIGKRTLQSFYSFKKERKAANNANVSLMMSKECLAMLIHTVRSAPPATDTSCEIRPCIDVPKDAPKTGSLLLTVRENEVMVLLAKGFPYKLIADELVISFSAVNQHLHRIYQKLGATNRTEAVNQWLDRPELGRVG